MTRESAASGRGAMAPWSAVLVLALLQGCVAFNLDTEHFTRHTAPGGRPGMFGFTVVPHRERGQSWVMVGAPEAQTRQAGVHKGGAVYRCDISRDNACAEVAFDSSGNKNDSMGFQIESKSNQWFGASLSSAGEDKPIVACAPRYVSYGTKNSREPVGTCYVARDGFRDFVEYAPCRTRDMGYHRQGSCQAGLGTALSADGQRLFIGAPGSWYWQGQLYSHGVGGEPALVYKTSESSPSDDDSYLGYSVAVGDFTGNGQQGVAVGMPRGSLLYGKVILYTWDLRNHQNLTGEQIGAYFGYCMCASDVDGDGLDDLVVGAPMYTVPNSEGKYDVGRIYVIYQKSEMGRYQRVHYRDGTMSRARFGLSLARLGDINMDGYGDFAVGAPYDGKTGSGAVYIYHGSANGVREKPSQIIRAEDIYSGPLSTFGFSVGGGLDLDSNEYSDLVVGAYETDTAFLFRAKPVVQMTASIEFGSQAKLISLDDRNCQLHNKQRVACTNITYCLEYKGIGVDTAVEFDLEFILDTKKPNDPRLFFVDNEGHYKRTMKIALVREELTCNILNVYIVDRVRDKLTPIEAEMKYSMRNQKSSSVVTSRNPRSVLQPILDQNVLNSQKDSINILKNCGPSNVCIPDLRVIATPSVT